MEPDRAEAGGSGDWSPLVDFGTVFRLGTALDNRRTGAAAGEFLSETQYVIIRDVIIVDVGGADKPVMAKSGTVGGSAYFT